MKRILSNGALIAAAAIMIYILILAAFYGSDKMYCAGYGYENKITPTFEGYCTRRIDVGVEEVVPVEYMILMKRNDMQGKRGWRNER